jgi:cell division protein FtsL
VPRFMLPLAIGSMLVSAFVLYGIKHDTQAIEARVLSKERAIEKALTDIAVLKAEKAHLLRPERIEPIARGLGFAPPTPQQIVRTEASVGGKATTGALPSPADCSAQADLPSSPRKGGGDAPQWTLPASGARSCDGRGAPR